METGNVYRESRLRSVIRRAMRRAGWHKSKHDAWITGRAYTLMVRHRAPWWDWGHRVMTLVGTPSGGNYDSPRPETWWYREGSPESMIRTGYPVHPMRTFKIIKGDYGRFRSIYEALKPDDQYAWKAIGINQDGELHLGRQYWGENFYGLNKWETRILRRYLAVWSVYNWFGLRSWIYSQALHAAVYKRKPFGCHAAPQQGGYSHWLCQERRAHSGPHRFNNYTWNDGQATQYVGNRS